MSEDYDMAGGLSRRGWLLATGTAGSVALSGCLGGDDDSDGNGPDGDPNGDDSNGADDQNGGDDANGSDDSNGGNEPGELSLYGLTINDAGETAQVSAEVDAPITVTAANNGGEDELTVSLEITEHDNGEGAGNEPVIEASETVTLETSEETDITFDGVTPDLEGGTYDLTVTGEGGEAVPEETQLTGELTIDATLELTVHVYTETADEENRPDAGTVLIHHDGETVAEQSLDGNPSPTFELQDARDRSYDIELQNVDGGVYPPEEMNITVTSYDPLDIELVAGYGFQNASSFNYTAHWFYEREDSNSSSERPGRGSFAEAGNFFVEYDQIGVGGSTLRVDDSLPRFEKTITELVSDRYFEVEQARIGIKSNDRRYYRGFRDESFNEVNESFQFEVGEYAPPQLVLEGLDTLTNPVTDERRFVERANYRDRRVDVYEINFEAVGRQYTPDDDKVSGDYAARVFVDPETGQILRFQAEVIADGFPVSEEFQVWEFYDHNDVSEIDISWIDSSLPDEN